MAKTTKKTAKEVKGKFIKRTLNLPLSKEEVSKKAHEAAKYSQEVNKYEAIRKEQSDKYKAIIDANSAKMHQNLNDISTGTSKREVSCEEIKDFDKKTVSYRYQGKIVETRQLTEEDKQLEFGAAKSKARKWQNANKALATTEKDFKKGDSKSAQIKQVYKEETGKNTAKSVLSNGLN